MAGAGVAETDAYIWISPEYHSAPAASIKNLFDYLTKEPMKGDVVGLCALAGGAMAALNTLNSMTTIARSLGAWVAPDYCALNSNEVKEGLTEGSARRLEAMCLERDRRRPPPPRSQAPKPTACRSNDRRGSAVNSAAAASPEGLVSTRVLFRESWRWLRKNWLRTLIFSVLSFLIAWAWNVWIMARKLEGSVADPGSETTATAQGKTWNGIYWLLCTTILFGLITYGREKGFKNLLREFFTPPFTFFENLFKRPRSAIAMACWGAALALLIGSVVSNAISGLLGLGFLLAAPTALAIVLNNVLIRAWIGAFSAAQPRLKSNATGAREPLRHDARRGDRCDPRVEDGRRRRCRSSSRVILIVVSFVVVATGQGKAAAEPDPADPVRRRRRRDVEGVARDTRARRRRRLARVRDGER